MPDNINKIVSKIVILLAIACTLFLFGKVIFRILRNKYAKVKTVKARVVDKFKADKFSKIYSPAVKSTQYFVVFVIDGKKKSFRVSEFSYGGYKLNERGTLKYKGDRLIDFS